MKTTILLYGDLFFVDSSAQITHTKKTFMLGSPFEMTVVVKDTVQEINISTKLLTKLNVLKI